MTQGRSEEQLQAEIRDLTAKLKQIREEIQEEIQQESRRYKSHPPVVDLADERPPRRRARKRR